jgi:hypothetical protein
MSLAKNKLLIFCQRMLRINNPGSHTLNYAAWFINLHNAGILSSSEVINFPGTATDEESETLYILSSPVPEFLSWAVSVGLSQEDADLLLLEHTLSLAGG